MQTCCKSFSLNLQHVKLKDLNMKKTFKIEIDCANCANEVEEACKRIEGVSELSVSFMTQKMKVTFTEGADPDEVMSRLVKTAKKIEPDFVIVNP